MAVPQGMQKLSSRPGIKPMPPAMEAESWSLDTSQGRSLSNKLLSPLYHTCKLAVPFRKKGNVKLLAEVSYMGFALLPKHQVRQLLRQRADLLCKYLHELNGESLKGKSFGADFQWCRSHLLWQGWGEIEIGPSQWMNLVPSHPPPKRKSKINYVNRVQWLSIYLIMLSLILECCRLI